MAVNEKIGKAVVEVSMSGYDGVKTKLDTLKKDEKAAATKGGGGTGAAATGTASMLARLGPLIAGAGAALAVVAVVLAGVAAGIAGVVVGLKKIDELVAKADPVRYSRLGAQFEVSSIIIGRKFIPLLQVALQWMEKFNNVLRKADGGGSSQFIRGIAAVLESVGNRILPIIEKSIIIINKAFLQLLPIVDELAIYFGEMLDGVEMLDLANSVIKPIAQLVVEATKAGVAFMKFYGPAVIAGMVLVGNQLMAWVRIVSLLLQAFNWLAAGVKSIFRGIVETIIDALNTTIKVMNHAISNVNKMIAKLPARVRPGSLPTIGEIRQPNWDKPKDRYKADPDKYTNNPLMSPKLEMFGVEDQFRKAFQAQPDPIKAAETERQRQFENKQISVLEGIERNTEKTNAAEMIT